MPCLATGQAREVRDRHQEQEGPENQVPFTVGVIVLGAKMAKADGIVTGRGQPSRRRSRCLKAEMKHAARIFDLAKQDVAGYEACAEQLVTVFKGNRKLLEDVLEGLFHIAKADGCCIHRRNSSSAKWPSASALPTPSSATSRPVTSSPPSAIPTTSRRQAVVSDEELKSHYRRLIADNHPDKLIARGVPKEFVTIATERVAAINAAYNAIAKDRGI